MRSCQEYESLISALLDGELTSRERQELEAHLAACPACRAYLEDQRRIAAALGALDAPAPEGIVEGVMARVRAENRRPAAKTARIHWKWWAAAAACLAVAAGLWRFQRQTSADTAAILRSAGPDAAMYGQGEPDSCSLEDGPALRLPLPDGTPSRAAVLTTDSTVAKAWVEAHLETDWESGQTYTLTAEEYAALREALAEAGEDFTEEAGDSDGESWLLEAR